MRHINFLIFFCGIYIDVCQLRAVERFAQNILQQQGAAVDCHNLDLVSIAPLVYCLHIHFTTISPIVLFSSQVA